MLRGIAANVFIDRLYIPFWGDRSHSKYGVHSVEFLPCRDLKIDQVFWIKAYKPSIDSLAIFPEGKFFYMPSGKEREDSNFWFVLDGISGKEKARIPAFSGSHNTITSLNQHRVYINSLQTRFLFLADTATQKVIRKIGLFGERVCPFTLNGRESNGNLLKKPVSLLNGFPSYFLWPQHNPETVGADDWSYLKP